MNYLLLTKEVIMKRFVPVLVIAFSLIFTALGVQPALADHARALSIVSASCDAGSQTLSVVVTHIGGPYHSAHTSAMEWETATDDGDFDQSFELGVGETTTLTASDDSFVAGAVVFIENESDELITGVVDEITVTCTSGGPTVFNDGRLNNRDYWESAAVYCEDGGITVYGYHHEWGSFLAFKISKAQLAKYPAKPASNILIIEKYGIRLYKLSSGEYQINAATNDPGKQYVYRWGQGC
jgi:hypothetical protein